MKKQLILLNLITLINCAVMLPSAWSQPEAEKTEASEAEVKRVTFLGIETSQVSQALRNHIDIPEGVGLTINHVVEDSGAADASLEQYDILIKVDDQIIINQDQLSTLIRSKEPGEKVNVEVLRKGETLKFQVTLGQRTEPMHTHWGQGHDFSFPFPKPSPQSWDFQFDMEGFQERMEEFQERAEEMGNKALEFIPEIIIEREGEDGSKRVTTLGRGPKTALISRDNIVARLEINDGEQHFRISRKQDDQEEILYEGKEPTEAELQTLPEEVQTLILQLKEQKPFNWKGLNKLNKDKIRVIINTGKEEANASAKQADPENA